MKTLICNYLKQHEQKLPPTPLEDYDFLRVELDNGRSVEVKPTPEGIEVRVPDGLLLSWPQSSNAITVEPIPVSERPGHPGRALGDGASDRFAALSCAAANLAHVAGRMRDQAVKTLGEDHYLIEKIDAHIHDVELARGER